MERYNLARRISGNINHAIHDDIKRATKEGEFMTLRGHPDYQEFKKWKGLRDVATEEIFKDLEAYKPRLQELGVDGVDFAKKLINHPADLVSANNDH